MSVTTACPLDCYDACEIKFEEGKIKASPRSFTSGFLCSHLNHYNDYETILTPRYKGEEISLEKALLKLLEMIKTKANNEILHYKGHGNFGLMQDVLEHFFASNNNILTDGTLCDGAGEAGILEGRGSNKNMSLSEIEKSEVVVFWGRNPHTSSSHILPIIKGKTVIVIDPLKTKIAKVADLHIQVKPHGDANLAMMIYRFLHIDGAFDEEYLEEYASEYEEYYELTQTLRVKKTLEEIDVSLGDIGAFIELVKDKKVAIVCGVGVQKYSDGADIMRAIDAVAVGLGLFSEEGSGVAYLGNSKEAIDSPFHTDAKRVSKVNTEFSDFKTVFVQGSNPVSQMPNSQRVKESISKVENLIYFGLYENETSEIADLIIPAKTFLAKNDIRTSYSHNLMLVMPKVKESDVGISEYDLSHYLCKEFDINIDSEENYLEHFKSFSVQEMDGMHHVEDREETAYKDGFDTDDDEFLFLDDIDKDFNMQDDFFLLTSKSAKSLNSQFKREKNVHLHSSHGYIDGDILEISSSIGSLRLTVKVNNDLRVDCVLIYSGTVGVNNLTSSKHSLDGKCAIYQEEKVKLKKVG